MASTINTLIRDLIKIDAKHDTTRAAKIAEIKVELKGQRVPLTDTKAVRAAITEGVAAYYGCATRAKERGEGVTLDRDDSKFDAAEQCIKRYVRDICGAKVHQSPPTVAIPRKLDAAVRALLAEGYTKAQIKAAVNQYE